MYSDHYNRRGQLSPFFRIKDLYVSINDTQETVTLHLCKSSCEVVQDKDIHDDIIQIFGSYGAIQILLNGEVLLSQLVKDKKVKVMGSYRTLLKLEAIFYLLRATKPPLQAQG